MSYMTTVSAACRLSPTPPARMDSRKTKTPEPGRKGARAGRAGGGKGKTGTARKELESRKTKTQEPGARELRRKRGKVQEREEQEWGGQEQEREGNDGAVKMGGCNRGGGPPPVLFPGKLPDFPRSAALQG